MNQSQRAVKTILQEAAAEVRQLIMARVGQLTAARDFPTMLYANTRTPVSGKTNVYWAVSGLGMVVHVNERPEHFDECIILRPNGLFVSRQVYAVSTLSERWNRCPALPSPLTHLADDAVWLAHGADAMYQLNERRVLQFA